MSRGTRYALMVVAVAFTYGCDGSDNDKTSGSETDDKTPPVVSQAFSLKSFDNCEALETYIEDVAIQEMKVQVDQGGIYYGRALAEDGALPPMAAAGGDEAQGSKNAAPTAHTGTNNQVSGVDEADFVKNDGKRIFVISGNQLLAATSWPPQDLALAGRLTIEGQPTQMAFHGDRNRIVVFSSVYLPGDEPDSSKPSPGGAFAPEPCLADGVGWRCGWYAPTATKITVVDVSDTRALKSVREVYLPGSYVDARSIGASVRVVMTDTMRWPDGVRYYPEPDDAMPTPPTWTGGTASDAKDPDTAGEAPEAAWKAYEAAYEKWAAAKKEELKRKNEELIRAQRLEDWLPAAVAKAADGKLVDLGYECTDFHHADVPVHLGLASVVTLNLDKPDQLGRTSVVGQVHEVYASSSSLYLASQHWWWWPAAGQGDYSYLHKFDISDENAARYVASGGVDGHIINQFAMDEHEDHLRVATIINRNVADSAEPWRTETVNRVSVLAVGSGKLEVVGQTADMAKDERIQSARFIGDRGFLVTFRQVDPLFTLDLSAPKAPAIVGELKVPGFSSYIHPLGEDHLLTIGTYMPEPDASGRTDWEQRKVQLAVFDVSDMAKPTQKFIHLVGSPSASSDAQWEHKAFNFFAEKGLLAVPFSDWRAWSGVEGDYWDHFVSDLRVFHVDVKTGIVPKGKVAMGDVYRSRGTEPVWYPYYSPWVRRSVMASDDQNEFVYAISDAGIRVANVETPTTPIKTIVFPPLE